MDVGYPDVRRVPDPASAGPAIAGPAIAAAMEVGSATALRHVPAIDDLLPPIADEAASALAARPVTG